MRNGKFISKFLIILVVVALLLMSVESVGAAPKVTVENGVIEGLQEGSINVYKGIPYAKPPVGELRFAPPEGAEPWNGELDCTRFGFQCLQVPFFAGLEPFSEDCLTLNVWTPAKPGEEVKLPVYVFIHGGGFAAGSGSSPIYDGTSFAKKNVVMVTINYRLGAFGFFASQETFKRYGTTGNWGLLDQIKALEWVRDNIAAFGGDPDRVTIGGESAGSFSVSALVVSPLAKGLFRGVIMESGSILSLPQLSHYARGDLQKSIEASSVLSSIFEAGDDADGLTKMRKAEAEVLARLCPMGNDQTLTPPFLLAPVFDGKVIPKSPLDAIASGVVGVNFLVGFNNDEGSLFVSDDADESKWKTQITLMFGGEKALQVLDRFKIGAQDAPLESARQVVAYGIFSAGMKRFADIAADTGGNVYMYKFKYVFPDNERNGLGAAHASEMPFVFNTLSRGGLSGSEAEILADEMHTRWANFIKTGDPNVGDLPLSGVKWPKYDPKEAKVLYLDKKITSEVLEDKENIDFIANLVFGKEN